VRVIAAVLPGEPLQLRPDTHLARLAARYVDVEELPAQAEHLTLAQPAAQPGRPPGELAALPRDSEHSPRLPAGERLAVGLAELGRLDERARVDQRRAPGEAVPGGALGLHLVGGREDGQHLADGGGRVPSGEHGGQAVLDVLGREAVDALAAPPGEDVVPAL
jgi:hypothetical protein